MLKLARSEPAVHFGGVVLIVVVGLCVLEVIAVAGLGVAWAQQLHRHNAIACHADTAGFSERFLRHPTHATAPPASSATAAASSSLATTSGVGCVANMSGKLAVTTNIAAQRSPAHDAK